MRCSEVERELALGTGEIAPEALAAHLERCPRCSAWAEAARSLDQVWEQTRPDPLSPAAWNACWAQIERGLAAPAASAGPRPPRALWPLLLVAAAASLAWVALHLAPASKPAAGPALAAQPSPVSPLSASSRPSAHIEVPVGQTVLFNVDNGSMKVVQSNDAGSVDAPLGFYGADEFLAFYGLAEFLPDLVASREPSRPTLLEQEIAPQ